MNKLFRILAMAALMLTSVSCLDKEPLTSITPGMFWQTEKDANLSMIGMYDAMQKTYAADMYLWGESRSDNCQAAASGATATPYLTNSLVSTLSPCNWTNLYRTIHLANLAIKYVPTIQDIDEDTRDQFLAEAYTMRALMYFTGIRVWGDLPLITTPYEGLEGQKKYYDRSDVRDVMAQVRSDINNAIECFGNSAPSEVFRLTIGAAYALKADVHMWCAGTDDWFEDSTIADRAVFPVANPDIAAEYEAAIAAAEKLDELGYKDPKSAEEWKLTFDEPEASKDAIFFIEWEAANDGEAAFAKQIARSGNPTYKLRRELWAELCLRNDGVEDSGDGSSYPTIMDNRYYYMTDIERLLYMNGEEYICESSYDNQGIKQNIYFSKYSDWDPSRDNGDGNPTGGYVSPNELSDYFDIPVYRYTDIDLLRAEALNKLGRDGEAVAIINDLRERTGYIFTDASSIEHNRLDATDEENQAGLLQDIILKERQFDFYGEAKRWYDLIRTDKVGTTMDVILADRGITTGYTSAPERILFPIHSSAFEANPLLEQNDSYTKF